MRLLLTHPHFWPHVRRGAEREVHDLGTRLAAAGHEARLLTSMPGGVIARRNWDELRVTYLRRPPHGSASEEAAFAAVALPAILAMRGDVVAAFHYADGWAAVQARRLRRRPVVLKLTGTVDEQRMREVRFDRRLFREAVAGADEVWCNSVFARDAMAWTGRDMSIVPAGVDLARFRPTAPRAEAPVVLCTSAPSDPRKRLVDVLDAWPMVTREMPGARLRIAGTVPDHVRRSLLERLPAADRDSVELAGPLDDAALVDAYSSAWVTVAPAVSEALGLTTIESLACGTPVAGARSGATPEIVDASVGALFEPTDASDCARALVESLHLSSVEDVRDRCRAATARWDWAAVTDEVVGRLERLRH